MPYTLTVYPDEQLPAPRVGAVFAVVAVTASNDMHWGQCIVARLAPVDSQAPGAPAGIHNEELTNATE